MSGELKQTVHSQVIGKFQVDTLVTGIYRENSYLVQDLESDVAVLLDPGGEVDFIENHIAKKGKPLAAILLTHAHFDHIGAVHKLMAKYSIPCWVHAKEKKLLFRAPLYAIRFIQERVEIPKEVAFFETVESLPTLPIPFRALEVPGHTSGSVCFYGPGFAFTGDTLFFEKVGPTNYPESLPTELGSSVRKILETLTAETVLFPGHGKPWVVGDARTWWAQHENNAPVLQLFDGPVSKELGSRA